jgi:hypothetical protein
MLFHGDQGSGQNIGIGLLHRGAMYLGSANNMIKSGSFSNTSFLMQTMESNGFMALRRHRGKFGGTQPKLAFDREPRA